MRGEWASRRGEWASRRMEGALLLAACAWLVVIWAWDAAVLAMPVDDAHYYLVIARNLGAGHGMSFDGLEPTNGVHPLWLALLVPVVASFGHDTDTLVRVVLSFQLALVTTATIVLGRTVPAWRLISVILAALLIHPYAAKVILNGQESALAFAMGAGCIACWIWAEKKPQAMRRWLLLGALTGALPLARLEGATMSISIWCLAGWRARGESWGKPRLSGAILALLISGTWWLGSLATWGHVLPISALIKANQSGASSLFEVVALCVVGAGVIGLLVRFTSPGCWRPLAPLLLWCSLVVGGQWLVRRTLVPPIWYLAPCLLLVCVVGGSVRPRRAAVGVLLLVFVSFASLSWSYRLDPRSYGVYAQARAAGEWIRDHVPAEARVAGWDCGFVAAYAARPISNLEGLVSSFRYRDEYLEPQRVDAFLDDQGIDYLVQYYPDAWLRQIANRDDAVLEGAVDPAPWHVASARCFVARRIHTPIPQKYWFLVLQRDRGGLSLAAFAAGLSSDSAREARHTAAASTRSWPGSPPCTSGDRLD